MQNIFHEKFLCIRFVCYLAIYTAILNPQKVGVELSIFNYLAVCMGVAPASNFLQR